MTKLAATAIARQSTDKILLAVVKSLLRREKGIEIYVVTPQNVRIAPMVSYMTESPYRSYSLVNWMSTASAFFLNTSNASLNSTANPLITGFIIEIMGNAQATQIPTKTGRIVKSKMIDLCKTSCTVILMRYVISHRLSVAEMKPGTMKKRVHLINVTGTMFA